MAEWYNDLSVLERSKLDDFLNILKDKESELSKLIIQGYLNKEETVEVHDYENYDAFKNLEEYSGIFQEINEKVRKLDFSRRRCGCQRHGADYYYVITLYYNCT